MSRRAEQVASLLRTAIQEVIARGFQDPRIRGLITITELTVSPDLKTATIMVSVLPEERQDLTMHGLRAAATHIRHQVSDRLDLRVTPDLHFKVDSSLKKQAGVFEALARVAEEREAKGSSAAIADTPTVGTPSQPPAPKRTDRDTQEEAAP